MTFDNEITEVFKSKLFCDMCKRYGGNNHLDLRSEVILIILELPEEKKQMIIENGYLLPYSLQIIRFQVSTKNWTAFRKKYCNRENLEYKEDFKDIPDEQPVQTIDCENIVSKIKTDTIEQRNKYFYHSRLLEELIAHDNNIKALARSIGIPYRSVIYAITEYRKHLKQWANND